MKRPKTYSDENLDHIAFPLGGLGAGMFAVSGTGAYTAFSLWNEPDINYEPCTFAAITIKGTKNVSRILEGQVPRRKIFGGGLNLTERSQDAQARTKANGLARTSYGLPRLQECVFSSQFPFSEIHFEDENVPLELSLCAWSPFTPPDADDSSLPAAVLEYRFKNNTSDAVEAVFYYSCLNFMAFEEDMSEVYRHKNGFILSQKPITGNPEQQGQFYASIDDDGVKVNSGLFRGGWFDPLTMLWNDIEAGRSIDHAYEAGDSAPSPGGSLSLPFSLSPGQEKTIRVLCCWYVPDSKLRFGAELDNGSCCCGSCMKEILPRHQPWYAGKFNNVESVAAYVEQNYHRLFEESDLFRRTFYQSATEDIVLEAIGANLTILKSPTILRQKDGRLWCWEGCCDAEGCCSGTCTHVWNYAQALCHLFPSLERGIRETEFFECQNNDGHQHFRAPLPIRPSGHHFYAASDGQLGGIMKIYRDYRISGDIGWLEKMWGRVKSSMAYCIETWDPDRLGVLTEPHHNTYDIEFWGPDSMCSSFYLGALKAMMVICDLLNEDKTEYEALYNKGKAYLEEKLFNGEYFFQDVRWKDLRAKLPAAGQTALNDRISPEAVSLMEQYGPKYQYGTGCLSDGLVGCWLAKLAGLGDILDKEKTISHLLSVLKYNLKSDFSTLANPQRPGFCVGHEAGLLLCSWPRGGKPALPFVYSDEVWTGIEYQVASHLILMGYADEGLDIVKACRSRYTGVQRNPFDEYECGHWYARALASFALLESFSGMQYDAASKMFTIKTARKEDFQMFFACSTGYGLAGMRNGNPFVQAVKGTIEVEHFRIFLGDLPVFPLNEREKACKV